MISIFMAAIGMVTGISALVIVLLDRDRPRGTPVEGIDGLDHALSAGCDLPTAEVPRPTAGTLYAGSHRRTGPSRWLAHLGRNHLGRPAQKTRVLP